MDFWLNVSIAYLIMYFIILVICALTSKQIARTALLIGGIGFIAAMCVLAYCTYPSVEDDLYRYFMQMDEYRYQTLQYALSNGLWKNNILFTYILFAVSQLNDNHLLPAFVALVTWVIYFYILVDSSEGKKVSFRKHLMTLLLIISSLDLYGYISGVRNTLAISIAILAVYIDLYKDKKYKLFALLLYASTVLIHSSMVNLIVLRLVYNLRFIKKHKVLLIITLILSYGIVVNNLASSNIPFISGIYEKTQIYNEQSAVAQSWKLLLGYVLMYSGILLSAFATSRNNENNRNSSMKQFVMIGVIYVASMYISIDLLFYRFTPLFIGISIPYIDDVLCERKYRQIIYLLFGIAILIMNIYSIRNNYLRWEFIR